MNNTIIITIGIIIGITILFFLVGGDIEDNTKPQVAVPDNWELYTNPAFDFTFRYPPEARIQHEAGNVKVQVIHPESNRGEITDGFTFYISTEPISQSITLEQFSQQQFSEATGHLEAITEPHEIQIGDRKAYQFSTRGPAGSGTTRIQMEGIGQRIFTISHIISGPEGRDYNETVELMINSAELNNAR